MQKGIQEDPAEVASKKEEQKIKEDSAEVIDKQTAVKQLKNGDGAVERDQDAKDQADKIEQQEEKEIATPPAKKRT